LQLQKITDPELLNEMQKKSQMRKELYKRQREALKKFSDIIKNSEINTG
jgi:hypothetical protein